MRQHAAFGLHVLPDQAQVVDAVQRAAVGADGQRGLHVAQRRVVGDRQRAHAQARDIERDGAAQRCRSRRCARGRRPGRQRHDVHGVGHPRGERRADPGAGVRMPAQGQAGDVQVRDGDLHRRFDGAQRADAQVAATERALYIDHREARHVLQQPARAVFAAPQRAADGHARAGGQRGRGRGHRGDARDTLPRRAPPRRGGRFGRVGHGLGHRELQKTTPTLRSIRLRWKPSGVDQSMFNGPTGLRQRTPTP